MGTLDLCKTLPCLQQLLLFRSDRHPEPRIYCGTLNSLELEPKEEQRNENKRKGMGKERRGS